MKLLSIYITILLVLSILTSTTTTTTTGSSSASTTTTTSYDYYIFACEWAGSVCEMEDCTSQYTQGLNPNFMNIHGLWPFKEHGQAPHNCSNQSFNLSKISQETQENMLADWSGLYSSAFSFHQHEWEKHGSCWNDPDAESKDVINDYFTKVIEIAQNFDMHNELQLHGIVPSDTESYESEDIQNAIQEIYGYPGIIICLKSDTGSLLFNGVFMCLDLDYTPMECPPNANFTGNCPGKLQYPILDLSFGIHVENENAFLE